MQQLLADKFVPKIVSKYTKEDEKEVHKDRKAMNILYIHCYLARTTQKSDHGPYPTQNPNSYTYQNLGYYPNSVPLNPPSFNEFDKRINFLEKSIEALLKSQQSFMQTMTQNRQLLHSNTEAISNLEVQVSKLANTINEREKNQFSSQLEVKPKFYPTQKPYENMNFIISLRSGNQFNNHVGVNTEEEDKLTFEPNHLLLNPCVNQSLSPIHSEKVQSSEPSPSDEQPSKPISDVSSEKVLIPKVLYLQRLTSWSNLEGIQIESILKEDVLLEYESNRELHHLHSSFSSYEMLDELNTICSKHESQLEDSFYDLKSIVKNYVGEPPPLISKPLISTLDQSFPNDNGTHDVISTDIVHNQEF